MFKRLSLMTVGVLLILFMITPTVSAFTELSEGTYKIEYEMKERSSENTSIADGYFTSPATLFVEDGETYVQITVTGADMIKELTAPSGPVEIVAEDEENDERTVKFLVEEDMNEPLTLEMHIVVPDLYDTVHEARAFFDVSSLEEVESAATTSSEDVENPQTGVKSNMAIYVTLLIGSIALVTIYRRKVVKE